MSKQTLHDLWALTKPRIVYLNVFMTALGLWLAPGETSWVVMVLALLGCALAVASANALNMYFERDFDRLMARTKKRPLPAGRLGASAALVFGAILGLIAIPLLAWGVNLLTAGLALLALVSYVWIYTPLKRRSPLALLVGAIPGAIPPLLGWTAVTGSLGTPGVVLFAILFLWQIPHFLAIAICYRRDYERAGIQIFPAVYGEESAKRQAFVYTVGLLVASLLLVPLKVAGVLYFATAIGLGGWFIWVCLRGMTPSAGPGWARQLFIVSLIYLPALGVGLIIDKALF